MNCQILKELMADLGTQEGIEWYSKFACGIIKMRCTGEEERKKKKK